ncbi:TetR/AcrR family transcriptional regulator, partial [Enterobacter sp. 63]
MIKNRLSTNSQESMFSKNSSLKTKKAGEVKAATRRKPSQERSIERHSQILKAAESCILEVGAANLKILDIARASNMPHASIYQYFNNREEIIAALLIKTTQEFYDEAMALFALATDETAFVKFIEKLIHAFHDFVKSNLTYQEIWWGAQGWETMRRMDPVSYTHL